ncbi:Glucokinase [Anatilimnocola aggregata]|uniref:Glucokinase n=1 Tax=Anatilimnocola aggregata TaxID=2528021 RepID=A0A517YGH6_9BACT|nr:ROK family protein [Anatilimnocola aggregata]QDU29333.1 Glucokinase [Anatilimnocola aggregata]
MSTAHVKTVSPAEAKRPLFLGIDVGGTNIKLGVVDDLGRTLTLTKVPTHEEEGPEAALQRCRTATDAMMRAMDLGRSDLSAIGLATPGTMDIPSGMLVEPHNLPHWYHFPIRDRVGQIWGLPTSYANDANAAAYGEFWVGGGQQYHSIIMLTLGTGVGGGIIIGDLSIDGENSCGSECGHIIIDCNPTARMCGCGKRGHLEAYCSATGLLAHTGALLEKGPKTTLLDRISEADPLTPKMIAEEAERGDKFSLDLIDELAMYLGFGVVSLIHTIDPAVVLLGGAMNFGGSDHPLGRRFLERVRSIVRDHAFPIPAQRTTIDFALLEGEAGYIGAAGIARLAWHQKKK